MTSPRIGLLTCSFAGDFALCRTLTESVARHARIRVLHRLCVPRRDLALFRTLEGPGTEVIALEETLPASFLNLPRPPAFIRRRVPLLRRDIYLTPVGLVRGWIMQQVIKLAAAAAMPTEMVLHCDSDVALVRPFEEEELLPGGRPRLLSVPGEGRLDTHLPWHTAAAELLGLPPTEYLGADHIGSLIPWHRDTVRALLARVEEVAHGPWQRAIARRWQFSEYILYGAYAQHSSLAAVPHAPTPLSLCHSSWGHDVHSPEGIARFVASLAPHHIGADIQSTEGLPTPAREAILAALEARAASMAEAAR